MVVLHRRRQPPGESQPLRRAVGRQRRTESAPPGSCRRGSPRAASTRSGSGTGRRRSPRWTREPEPEPLGDLRQLRVEPEPAPWPGSRRSGRRGAPGRPRRPLRNCQRIDSSGRSGSSASSYVPPATSAQPSVIASRSGGHAFGVALGLVLDRPRRGEERDGDVRLQGVGEHSRRHAPGRAGRGRSGRRRPDRTARAPGSAARTPRGGGWSRGRRSPACQASAPGEDLAGQALVVEASAWPIAIVRSRSHQRAVPSARKSSATAIIRLVGRGLRRARPAPRLLLELADQRVPVGPRFDQDRAGVLDLGAVARGEPLGRPLGDDADLVRPGRRRGVDRLDPGQLARPARAAPGARGPRPPHQAAWAGVVGEVRRRLLAVVRDQGDERPAGADGQGLGFGERLGLGPAGLDRASAAGSVDGGRTRARSDCGPR